MTWAVSRLLGNAEAQIRTGTTLCRIYVGQSGKEVGYSSRIYTSSVSNAPPIFVARFIFEAILIRRTSGRNLNT
jgi:hypothetical protein